MQNKIKNFQKNTTELHSDINIKEVCKLDYQTSKKNDFLMMVYEQCNLVYLSFVHVRFQMFSLFILNAALFYFLHNLEIKTQALITFISVVAIFFSWTLFFIDQRNRHIFRRAVRIASKIEAYFNISVEMRLHTKMPIDLRNRVSHSIIFVMLVIVFTVFWILYAIFHNILVGVS
jgi:hypothetical protein